jgi:hypothetical protein
MNENKKLHLEHPEDFIFKEYVETFKALDLMQDIHDAINKFDSNITLQYKVDGSPNLIFGIHPENRRFFVGTKSVFAKNSKINYTYEDIYKNHKDPNLREILYTALEFLPKLFHNGHYIKVGVFSGDVMFTRNTLGEKIIHGLRREHTFKPNIIRYVPQNPTVMYPGGSSYDVYKIGLYIHTAYFGKTLENMKAVYQNQSLRDFCYNKNVWLGNCEFPLKLVDPFSDADNDEWNGAFNYCSKILCTLKIQNLLIDEIKPYFSPFVNDCVENDFHEINVNVSRFENFIEQTIWDEISHLKTKRLKI